MLMVGVLGPLVVSARGRPVQVSAPTLRTLLMVLAMAAGSPVSVDRLADALWEDDLPEHRRRAVQTHLTRLRGVLGAGVIVTEPAGYRIRVDPDRVDALRFTRLLDLAARAPDPAGERGQLEAALALWRGTPFDDARSPRLQRMREPLVQRYLSAVERRVDLDLAEGRHSDAVVWLQELTASHPLREPLWVRLLTALVRSGRQAEALSQYESVRRRLADELGTVPGTELRQLHADLLAAAPVPTSGRPAPETVPVPRQLPADIHGFTGRAAALKALQALVDDCRRRTTAVATSTITGMAGIGKTALAVHWAHAVADQFPDGQLYMNLRGFHSCGQAVTPADAVRRFLDALGIPSPQVPADPEAQVGMYRSLLAGRRMLMVLDNARDADQVRPLLPGSPTCVVLVTSRDRLTGLAATEAAQPLSLGVLAADEARDLLAARLGPQRIAAEPAATDRIIGRCAGLPLALAVTAARAATYSLALTTVAGQLAGQRSTLDTLDTGDPSTDARVVFSWSYRTLTAGAARLFRLLSLHIGPDIATGAAASLAGVTPAQVRPLLAELHRTHLLTEHTPGRYTLHDLLRTYAAELASVHDTGQRHAALSRLLDHYLHTAHTAARALNPLRRPITVGAPHPGVTPESPGGPDGALTWYRAEHRVLLAAVEQAAAAGFDTHAWQLAWTMTDFLFRCGRWHEWVSIQRTAVEAARRLSDEHVSARL